MERWLKQKICILFENFESHERINNHTDTLSLVAEGEKSRPQKKIIMQSMITHIMVIESDSENVLVSLYSLKAASHYWDVNCS